MYASGKGGKIKCPNCQEREKTRYMFQVPFVAMCENGHIQDFPWREWVHAQSNPVCQGDLELISTGSASLAGQKVICEGCGKERTLAGITTAYPNGTTLLSKTLAESTELFLCQGKKTWLGEDIQEQCDSQLRGSLRSASNLYFAQIMSSIYLPITEVENLQQLENILQNPQVSNLLATLRDFEKDLEPLPTEKIAKAIRKNFARLVIDYSDNQIVTALQNILDNQRTPFAELEIVEDHHTAFRRAEYAVLLSERSEEFLKIKQGDLNSYNYDLQKYFSKIMLISKLRETRVLAGFTRIVAENDQDRDQRQALL